MKKHYKASVKKTTEYWAVLIEVLYPDHQRYYLMQFKRNMEKLKQVQKRYFKIVTDLETTPYQEWYTFHFQKIKINMPMVYKYLKSCDMMLCIIRWDISVLDSNWKLEKDKII